MTGTMEVMDVAHGDSKIMWDSDNDAEVAAAKAQFDALTAKGYHAFRVNKDGEAGERLRNFDKNAEALVLVPQIRGG